MGGYIVTTQASSLGLMSGLKQTLVGRKQNAHAHTC